MKKNNLINNWTRGSRKTRSPHLLTLCCNWIEAHTNLNSALARPVQLIPIRIQAETRFTPQIVYRPAEPNSLPGARRVRRIEPPRRNRRYWPE